jgi:phosphatidate cytidylyltransferase
VRKPEPRIVAPGLVALAVATGLVGATEPTAAIAAIVIGALLVGGLVAFWPGCDLPPFWAAGGVVYAGVVLLSPTLLRNDPKFGLQALLFLFAVVWSTDICAYLIGRAVGGPLLWPRVSPNKTWSGAIGGLIGGVAAGIAVAYASGGARAAIAGVLALVLSIVAQGGDLFESAVKRRFGVKDTSHLIPGHGGVMDRLDGFLVAALAAVLIGILRQGVAAPGRGLLAW